MVVEQEPTHQWECWVNAKVGDMSKYVDKVVFNLHETFPKPKRGKIKDVLRGVYFKSFDIDFQLKSFLSTQYTPY